MAIQEVRVATCSIEQLGVNEFGSVESLQYKWVEPKHIVS
jgi:hypothetical protein